MSNSNAGDGGATSANDSASLSGSLDDAAKGRAYAQAAWQRFEEDIDEPLLKAVTGAFVLVAASDGNLATEEAERFLSLMHGRARLFPRLDFDAVAATYRDLTSALISDPAGGRARALGYLSAVKTKASHCELVLAAARVSLDADNEQREEEFAVLSQIKQALDLPA